MLSAPNCNLMMKTTQFPLFTHLSNLEHWVSVWDNQILQSDWVERVADWVVDSSVWRFYWHDRLLPFCEKSCHLEQILLIFSIFAVPNLQKHMVRTRLSLNTNNLSRCCTPFCICNCVKWPFFLTHIFTCSLTLCSAIQIQYTFNDSWIMNHACCWQFSDRCQLFVCDTDRQSCLV